MSPEEFNVALAGAYWVMDGPPVAYFELPAEYPEQPMYRISYTAIRLNGPEPYCWSALLAMLKGDAVDRDSISCLFWRKRPEYADGQLYCRVAIPGATLSAKGEYYLGVEINVQNAGASA